jgi:hypothetical protein
MNWLGFLKKIMCRRCIEPYHSGAEKEYTLYTRTQGPLCYELPLFCWQVPSDTFFEQLFGSSLQWYWESARRYDSSPTTSALGLPATRPLTPLTETNTDEFKKDLQERDLNDDMRFIGLYGVDPNVRPDSPLSAWLHKALQEFMRFEQGPLWIVVIQIGDCNEELVYTTHTPPDPVLGLLRVWGVEGKAPRRVLPYHRLWLAKLEEMQLVIDRGDK